MKSGLPSVHKEFEEPPASPPLLRDGDDERSLSTGNKMKGMCTVHAKNLIYLPRYENIWLPTLGRPAISSASSVGNDDDTSRTCS